MSSLSQASWVCSLYTTKNLVSTKPKSTHFAPQNHKNPSFKPLKITAFAVNNSKEESLGEPSSPNAPENPENSTTPDRVKLALQKAREYKKTLQVQQSSNDPVAQSPGNGNGVSKEAPEEDTQSLSGDTNTGKKEVPEAVSLAMEKTGEYENNKGSPESDSGRERMENLSEDGDDGVERVPEAVRIAMEKAREYKKNKGVLRDVKSNKEIDKLSGSEEKEVPEAVRIAIGKASEYKENKGSSDNSTASKNDSNVTGLVGGGTGKSKSGNSETNADRKEDLKVSSIDFVGLNFADKKSGRGLPAGLVPVSDPFPEGDLPEIEILVGDSSKFGNTASVEVKNDSGEESSDLYKPKVTTWGMFPRPSNISKTFGGGRTIRPGEALETAEDRVIKEARTKQLLAAYKRKTGVNMDPKIKAECEKAMKDGDSLMDGGRLKEALPYYQKVMDNLAFQTELHGLAALQWSICQDSLSRPEKARGMYEKLQTHPNSLVSKKARQFMFSFQAMEMMKVTRPNASPRNAGYQRYFEAFIEDKPNYTPENTEAKEDPLDQALPYIIFLAAPILLVLLIAASKGR